MGNIKRNHGQNWQMKTAEQIRMIDDCLHDRRIEGLRDRDVEFLEALKARRDLSSLQRRRLDIVWEKATEDG